VARWKWVPGEGFLRLPALVTIPLDRLRAALANKILAPGQIDDDGSRDFLVALADEPPAIVYHYTSGEVLSSIVNGRRLYATNAFYLSDKTEIVHGLDLFRERAKRRDDGPEIKHFLGQVSTFLSSSADPHHDDGFDTYVACFSEKSDVIPFWKGYGADGLGYALGFDLEATWKSADLAAYRVVYDKSDQEAILDVAVEGYIGVLKRSLDRYPGQEEAVVQATGITLASVLMQLLAFFKHESFDYEVEWRLVQFIPRFRERRERTARCRISRGVVVPFVEIELGKDIASLPLREVRCGPVIHKGVGADTVRAFAKRAGLSCEVTESGLPPMRFL
jgi:Protein of unknown function (DUF2971)